MGSVKRARVRMISEVRRSGGCITSLAGCDAGFGSWGLAWDPASTTLRVSPVLLLPVRFTGLLRPLAEDGGFFAALRGMIAPVHG
ncbi:MAG: hypothetical protein BroJett014_09460 [Planctomycetota bacterium]|nr:MAG: hypothetical protein BroJett014_09460 [Planctomycetota bacterium]